MNSNGFADVSPAAPGHLRAVRPTEPVPSTQSLFLEGRSIGQSMGMPGALVEVVKPVPGSADTEPIHLVAHDLSIVVDQRSDGSRYICIQNPMLGS